jgi:hypothetical protein
MEKRLHSRNYRRSTDLKANSSQKVQLLLAVTWILKMIAFFAWKKFVTATSPSICKECDGFMRQFIHFQREINTDKKILDRRLSILIN